MKKSNNQQLQELLEKHGKSRQWTADVLCTNKSTVDRWMVPRQDPEDRRRKNTTYRAMPSSALALVRILLGEISPQGYLLSLLTQGKKNS